MATEATRRRSQRSRPRTTTSKAASKRSISPIGSSNGSHCGINSAGRRGYLLTTEILAHELVHAVDMDQRYSGTETFRRSVRLGMPPALQAEVDAANAARRPLVDAGRHADDWYASRSFAIVRLRGRSPSLHALEGYREAFAEVGAHLVLDANARAQFEPRVIQYFTRAVSGQTP